MEVFNHGDLVCAFPAHCFRRAFFWGGSTTASFLRQLSFTTPANRGFVPPNLAFSMLDLTGRASPNPFAQGVPPP
jgi:hypothetical protein